MLRGLTKEEYHLVAPIKWARLLVHGRPGHSLKVFRTLTYENDPYDSFYDIYDPYHLVQILSKTSSRIEELSLPFLGTAKDFHILEVIAHFFPFVKILSLVLSDAGLNHIPEATPSPPPSPRPRTSEVDVPVTSASTLHLLQEPALQGRHHTPFYFHQQEKVLELLSVRYPALHEVKWTFTTTVLDLRRHRYWLVEGEWVCSPTIRWNGSVNDLQL